MTLHRCLAVLAVVLLCWLDAAAQRWDTTFKLLWYKGSMLNDSTLLTPSGQTVTYNPRTGKIQVNTPPKNDVLSNVRKQLAVNEQRKVQLNRVIVKAKHGVLYTGLSYHINKVVDEVAARAEPLKENTIDIDPLTSDGGYTGSILAYIIERYEQVRDYIRDLKNHPAGQPPPPASADVDYCYPCDAMRQAAYKRDSAIFIDYTEEERKNIQKAISVIQYFDFRRSKGLPYDTVRAERIVPEMWNAVATLTERIGNKLLSAWTMYKDDASKIPFLSLQILSFQRNVQLMGFPSPAGFPTIDQLAQHALLAADKQLSKAVQEKDYRVLLNIGWIISIFRTAELLGMDTEKLENSLMKFLRINHFVLTVEAEAVVETNGVTQSAKMSGENFYGVVPDSNCVLKWKLLEPDSSKMKFSLDDVKFRTPKASPVYIGTRSWQSPPANLQLDFCKAEKDTAMLFAFAPLDGQELWTVEGQTHPIQIVASLFMSCFTDVERLKQMANDPALKARLMQEMQEKHKEFMANYSGKDPSAMTPKELERMNEAMKSAGDITNIIFSIQPHAIICKERLRNKQTIVFEKKVNGKELIPQNTAIQLAMFGVTIEHKGN